MTTFIHHLTQALLILALTIAQVQAAAFMKLGDIKGEAIEPGHEDEIDVLAWSWGAHHTVSPLHGPGKPPKISPRVSSMEMSFTKYQDKASVPLFRYCANGTHIDEAVLVVRKAGDRSKYYEIKMEKVFITSVSTGGSGGEDILTENVTLNFSKFDVKYTPQKPDGSEGEPEELQYDLQTRKDI